MFDELKLHRIARCFTCLVALLKQPAAVLCAAADAGEKPAEWLAREPTWTWSSPPPPGGKKSCPPSPPLQEEDEEKWKATQLQPGVWNI